MSYRGFNRTVYKTILHLHPAPFRERFSQEMLWIFDEMVGEIGMPRLAMDGLSSLLKQWSTTEAVPQPATTTPFQFAPARPMSVAIIAPSALIVTLALVGFSRLLQQNVPLPQPPKTFEVRRSSLDLCDDYAKHPLHHMLTRKSRD